MKTYLTFVYSILVIPFISVACYSQSSESINTSKAGASSLDSINLVKRFVRNAKANEDSLTKFEALKLKVKPLQNDLKACETNRDALASELFFCKQDRNELATKLYKSDDRAVKYLRQRNRARWENWTWRGVAVYAAYQLIKTTIQR